MANASRSRFIGGIVVFVGDGGALPDVVTETLTRCPVLERWPAPSQLLVELTVYGWEGDTLASETGLHYNWHRYYDPASGRFVSKDPIGPADGDNVYQYAPNPMQWVDPLRLTNTFLSNPDDMTKVLSVDLKIGTTPDGTPRYTWFPNSNTRIRYENHLEGLCSCDKVTKSQPDGYMPGSGTGFNPGENFPES